MPAGSPAVPSQEGAAADQALGTALRQLLDAAPSHLLDNQPIDLASLRRFYAGRGNRPAWAGSDAARERAKLALSTLAAAEGEGLNPADYHLTALSALPPPDAAGAAARELLLTDAFLRYSHDLRLGRVAADEVFDDVHLPKASFDALRALETALQRNDLAGLIADLPPRHPEYARLKDALKRYRAIVANGGWPQIPPGDELKLDKQDPRLVVLRQRLAVEDAQLTPLPAEAVKGDLEAALGRYQARNDLAVDGRIGAKTFAMLNISAAERVDQIIANMERWRWMPRSFEERYIMVNTADGELEVVDHGEPILLSKVVVGDERHQSPILRAYAVSVTVNPPWRVPLSIAEKEFLPKLKRDPNYLFNENIVIVNGPEGDPYGQRIAWKHVQATRFPYVLEQLPGPKNSLGGLKIEMPNPFDVYLHDTPLRRLFARAQRNFSHGCIRVEHVAALASLLLTGDKAEAIPDLEADIAAGETLNLPAKKALAVYVAYWTAMEDADGTVGFRADAYDRDGRLTRALASHSRLISLLKEAPRAAAR
ncbi:MAG TPA: L,D-transpeptidase family protein [Alphaproteobacteria bacterium]|nr:L,D-transpeptidase family protein [Alphaproteobacteria bacterium]